MSAFRRLHPQLQHALVHEVGWRDLRPVQELTIDAVLDGANAVVLAPTAGGKTEASLFPVLSRILTEELRPVAALYVCPIRALLNNQEDRIGRYAGMVGLSAFKWHGDVADSKRARFRGDPAHVLMTTPESLEVMMISARTDAHALFAGLGAVIVDEVHAFAADDRGAHLASLLERIGQLAGRDLQRIGLSATVGNPHVIGQWLAGSSRRPLRIVDPPGPPAGRDMAIELCTDLGEAAAGIARVTRGKKSLVFVESRAKAERVAHALSGSGVEVFIHHSSVSRADRALAEAQFAEGHNTAIVCTSTMELGLDIGDLDQVIQVDAPSTVASFLQRVGRTGRRAGTRSNCTFFCLAPESLLQAVAILGLAERGWVDDVRPSERAVHVLAHQIMALSLQEGGISRHRVLLWLSEAYPFVGLAPDRLQQLVDTMLERQILYEADGLLTLGARGESLYGRRHFFELYAVFSSPPVLRVVSGKDEVGYVQAGFVQAHDQREGPLCFRLAGRPWQVVSADWSKGVLHVRPAEHGTVPNWLGAPGGLSFELCQAMMEALTGDIPVPAVLSASAELELASLRQGYAGLLEPGTAPLEETADAVQWHTFAGGAINRLLTAGLEAVTRKSWRTGNLSIRAKDVTLSEARDAVQSLGGLEWESLGARRAREMARGMVSKFQPCLPADAEDRLLAEELLDVPGTLRFLTRVRVGGSVVGLAGPRRLVDIGPEEPGPVPRAALPPGRESYVPQNPIRLVEDSADLARAVEALASEPILGLDTETTLDFGAVCLIQLGSRTETFVVDALLVQDLGALRRVLGSAAVVKISHNARFEARMLAQLGFEVVGAFDTLEASRRLRGMDALGGHGLAAVCERELGVMIRKDEQTSDWAHRPLSAAQLRYAAVDVEILLPLHDRLTRTA